MEALTPVDAASPSLASLCERFLTAARQEGAEIAKTFSFPQHEPKCRVGTPPAHWTPAGSFLDARAVDVTYVARQETRLALRLARGWVLTPLAWNVRESESATPLWTKLAPEKFVISASHLVAYVPGADMAHNESVPANATHRMLRGAFACRDTGTQLLCWEWNPTAQTPLGTKEMPRGFKAWNERPWTNERALIFGSDDAGVALPPHL